MDSSTVLACAVELTGRTQHAYSTTYSGQRLRRVATKSPDARRDRCGMAPGRGRRLPTWSTSSTRMIDAHDEPVATATWLSHFLLCGEVAAAGSTALRRPRRRRAQRGRVRVLLLPLRRPARDWRRGDLRHEVELWPRHHDHPIFRKNWDVDGGGADAAGRFEAPGPNPGRPQPHRAIPPSGQPGLFDIAEFEPVMDRPFDELPARTAPTRTSSGRRRPAACALRTARRRRTA